jgi:hypothetical protein
MLPDINGRYLIYNQDAMGMRMDPDYSWVYFSLYSPEPFENGDVYVLGGFTFGEILDRYRMTYNEKFRTYEAKALLKQGYLNFIFGLVRKGTAVADIGPVDGNFSECENDYAIYVYLRQQGDLQHRLVAVRFLNSLTDR